MGINVEINDGNGSGYSAEVAYTHAVKTYTDIPPILPIGTANRKRFFKETVSGMNTNGSVTPIEYAINPATDYDILITRIVWVVSDGTQTLSKFGDIARLTNGVDLTITEGGVSTILINKAKTGGELLVESGMFSVFGQTSGVNTIVNWSTTEDALIAVFDIGSVMGGGLRLGRGTKDKIFITVNDNLTGLTEHFVQFFGYKLYE